MSEEDFFVLPPRSPTKTRHRASSVSRLNRVLDEWTPCTPRRPRVGHKVDETDSKIRPSSPAFSLSAAANVPGPKISTPSLKKLTCADMSSSSCADMSESASSSVYTLETGGPGTGYDERSLSPFSAGRGGTTIGGRSEDALKTPLASPRKSGIQKAQRSPIRTVEQKKKLLGRYLGNIDGLMARFDEMGGLGIVAETAG
jgi:hypothetical protein